MPAATRRAIGSFDPLEREHRRGDLGGGRVGDRGGGPFEHEQPRTGDLVRERFAVADGEERVAPTGGLGADARGD